MKHLSWKIAGAIGIAAWIVAAPSVHAQETGSGCGLGAEVLEGKSGKGSHIAAAILNGLVIPNTFFMTTGDGLMGCDPTQTVKNEEATEIFVASNLDRLSSEIAQGNGEYLNVLAELIGIAEEDKAAFKQIAQQNYDSLFDAEGDARRVIQSIETAMSGVSSLSKYAVN